MPRYTTLHYEDVAKLLRSERDAGLKALGDNQGSTAIACVMMGFADLFAADNPETCCGQPIDAVYDFCPQRGEAHRYGKGFNRAEFLRDCGIEGS